MKKISKIILWIMLLLNTWIITNYTYAANVTVINTEPFPWVSCNCIDNVNACNDVKTKKYKCEFPGWFWYVMALFWIIFRYVVFIVSLLAVLIIAISGIQMSMTWISSKAKDDAKKRITRIIIWMVLLFSFWFILHIFAPWIY